MVRLYRVIVITFLISTVNTPCADTSGQENKNPWHEDTQLSETIEKIIKDRGITNFELKNITSHGNDLIVAGFGNRPALGGYGAEPTVVIINTTTQKIDVYDKSYSFGTFSIQYINNQPIIAAIKSGNKTTFYYPITSYFAKPYLEPAKNSTYNTDTLTSVIGSSGPEYWVCSNNQCLLYNKKNVKVGLTKDGQPYTPSIVGLQPKETTSDTSTTYWTIGNTEISRVSIKNGEAKREMAHKSSQGEVLPPKLITLIPYTPTKGILLAEINKKYQLMQLLLEPETLTYSTLALDTPNNILSIGITKEDTSNLHHLYALVQKDNNKQILSASLSTLIIKAQAFRQAAQLSIQVQNPSTSTKGTQPSSSSTTPTTTTSLATTTTTTQSTEHKSEMPIPTPIIIPQEKTIPSLKPAESSDKYKVESDGILNSTKAAYTSKRDGKEYVFTITSTDAREKTIQIFEKNQKRPFPIAFKTVYGDGDIKILGIAPSLYGDRLVLKSNKCIWVDHFGLHFNSKIDIPSSDTECKNNIKKSIIAEKTVLDKKKEEEPDSEQLILGKDGIVYIVPQGKDETDSKAKRLGYQGHEIKAHAVIRLNPEDGHSAIITHSDYGTPELLMVNRIKQAAQTSEPTKEPSVEPKKKAPQPTIFERFTNGFSVVATKLTAWVSTKLQSIWRVLWRTA